MKVITLSGLRMGAEEEMPAIGGSCSGEGATELALGGAPGDWQSRCVFPSFRHKGGCAYDLHGTRLTDSLIEATLVGGSLSHYCVPRAAIDAGLATPIIEGNYQSTKKYLIAAGIGAGAGLLIGLLASKKSSTRLALTGVGAAGGAVVRAMMGLSGA